MFSGMAMATIEAATYNFFQSSHAFILVDVFMGQGTD
jgi:hypothetical protein